MVSVDSLGSISYLLTMDQKPLGPIFNELNELLVEKMTSDLDMTLKERSNVKFVFTQEFLV